MVSPKRFERSTHSLEGCCSIQLSYGLLYLLLDLLNYLTIYSLKKLLAGEFLTNKIKNQYFF